MTARAPAPPIPTARRRAALCVGLLALSGCSLLRGPTTEPTNFYVLTALARPADVAPVRRLTIGLGPVGLPTYLDRPEMVSRIAPNQLSYDEFQRWGEPLKDNFTHTMAADLDRLLNLERIIFYPWYRGTAMDYAVAINVQRFELQPDGTVALDARWGIGDGHGRVLASRDSHYTRPGGSAAENAAALSQLVSDLASEIASALGPPNAPER